MVDWWMLGACEAIVRTAAGWHSNFVEGFVQARLAGRTQPVRVLDGVAWPPEYVIEHRRLIYRLSDLVVANLSSRSARRSGDKYADSDLS